MDNQKQWWEESAKEFADGFTETRAQGISLGHYRASIDDSGKLSIFDDKQLVMLSADETYKLLIWLHDNFRDRLYQQTHESEG